MTNLTEIVKEILDVVGLKWATAKVIASPDGLPLVANLCNYLAKTVSETFYNFKEYLLFHAVESHNLYWYDEGILYFETLVGQVSFHVFSDEWEEIILPEAHGREWSQIETQFKAPALIVEYLEEMGGGMKL
jgi:hypothetical protein